VFNVISFSLFEDVTYNSSVAFIIVFAEGIDDMSNFIRGLSS